MKLKKLKRPRKDIVISTRLPHDIRDFLEYSAGVSNGWSLAKLVRNNMMNLYQSHIDHHKTCKGCQANYKEVFGKPFVYADVNHKVDHKVDHNEKPPIH
jgi:hypothetical protein